MNNLLTEAGKKAEEIKKKKIGKDTYIILILAGILLFIIALPTKKDTTQSSKGNKSGSTVLQEETMTAEAGVDKSKAVTEESSAAQYTGHLEVKLEKILSSMEGVGEVKVMITVQSTGEQIVEKDSPNSRSITTETDSEGGSRSVNDMTMEEKTIYTVDEQGNQIPYVAKKMEPHVEGVMVVAQGGANAIVNKNITEAIQALFGIEAHKITVIKMKS